MGAIVAWVLLEAFAWALVAVVYECCRQGYRQRRAEPPNPAWGAAVERARELRAEGLSHREIASALNRERYRDTAGAELSERSVRRALSEAGRGKCGR